MGDSFSVNGLISFVEKGLILSNTNIIVPWNINFHDKNFYSTFQHTEVDVIYWTAMGLHSKIPLCCITFWITSWVDKTTYKQKRKYFDFLKLIEEKKSIKIEYIPCPICIDEEKFIKLHYCKKDSPTCKKFTYENFKNNLRKALK